MKVFLYAACVAFVVGIVPAAAAMLDFSKPDPDAMQEAQKSWQSSIDEAKQAGSDSTIEAIKQDLNGDGKPEIVGLLHSSYLCGGNGACFFVMANTDSGYNLIFSVPGVDTVDVLDAKTNGWSNVKFNDLNTWVYDGSTYTFR